MPISHSGLLFWATLYNTQRTDIHQYIITAHQWHIVVYSNW